MMKYLYEISLNTIKNDANTYEYSFGRTEHIVLSISENAAKISTNLTRKYNVEDMLKSDMYLFPDALRKAMLLHILLYSNQIEVSNIYVQIADEHIFGIKDLFPITSIISNPLCRKLCKSWQNPKIIAEILKQTKSKYDSRMSSLFALICSKSKVYEAERFIYLWMAMNGMYNFFDRTLIEKQYNNKKYSSENAKIEHLQDFFSLGKETINRQHQSRLAHSIIHVITSCESKLDKYVLLDYENSITNKIRELLVKEDGKPYNLSPYGYILLNLSYYYRCNLLHASKPVPIFSYVDDKDVKILAIINNLIEDFVETYLPSWFDEEYIDSMVKNKK